MTALIRRAAIIGVGMVGGSLGRALLTRGLADEVIGIDEVPEVLKTAVSLGAVSRGATSLAAGIDGADLIIMAAPVGSVLSLLPQLAGLIKKPVLVSDVCSTKKQVSDRAREVLPAGVTFIGGHPMAGSEKGGVGALDEYLFENALYVLTADESTDGSALEIMLQLVKGVGAVPFVLDAARHDLLTAAISHLPHMAATALVSTVAAHKEYKNELLALAAGGFRDTTRVAMGSPQMWKDICLSNEDNIINLLENYIAELRRVCELIRKRDEPGLLAELRDAREFRLQVPTKGKGILPQMFNLYVYVPDRPGIIGDVASHLGSAGVNIAEIELLRVREEEGGPLRLGFLSGEGRKSAAALLHQEGFRAEMEEGEN
ncbi:MAG: prephenate dehydrogenase [Dethiobacter sp.]|nr:prephenate dehydrogenase [Dethiobacter sp.]